MDSLPTDVEVKLISAHAEHLQRQQEDILQLLRMHEQELVLLWVVFCGLLFVELYQLRILKERYGRSAP